MREEALRNHQVKLDFGSRHGDVEQATFLLDFRRDAIEAEAILKPCRYERG
jgi:hypothetical protein